MKASEGCKFYIYDQNNSGGYFIVNEDVAPYVIIESSSRKYADVLFNEISVSYSSYCKCCGKRWNGYEVTKELKGVEFVPFNELLAGNVDYAAVLYTQHFNMDNLQGRYYLSDFDYWESVSIQ